MTEEMYDSDEDQGSDEETEAPVQADAQVDRKLTRENQSLRRRLREMQDEVLKTRFSEDVVNLIPEEVTDYERRVALAEKWAPLIKPSSGEEVSTDQATSDDSQGELSAEEQDAIAAVAKGPVGTGTPGAGMSQEDLIQLAANDPGAYARLKKSGVALQRLPGSEL